MKSIIQKADWKMVLIIAIVVMVSVNILSDIVAHHIFFSTANEVKNSIDETKSFIKSTKAKAKKRDEEISAQFEENFDLIDEMHAEAEDKINRLEQRLNELNP